MILVDISEILFVASSSTVFYNVRFGSDISVWNEIDLFDFRCLYFRHILPVYNVCGHPHRGNYHRRRPRLSPDHSSGHAHRRSVGYRKCPRRSHRALQWPRSGPAALVVRHTTEWMGQWQVSELKYS